MNFGLLLDLANGLKRELYNYRFLAVFLFIAVTSGALVYGYMAPKTYTSNAVLHADVTNILQPLLSGSAVPTSVERINSAREIIYSRSMLERIAVSSGLITGVESEDQKNGILGTLRSSLRLRVSSGNYLNVSYSSGDANQSFRVLSAVLTEFINESVRRKRTESREAFEFIESQVQTYKRQLENAETALKDFRGSNFDGTEANVQSRIQNLRSQIEDLNLRIEETTTQIALTRQQLQNEQPYREITQSTGESEVDRRLASLRQQLDSLRLLYHDTHPDIVTLNGQIEDLQAQKAAGINNDPSRVVTEVIENPVYENLRLRLSNAETDLQTQRNRRASLERLLEEEFARQERIAANRAQETELMRDYDVTRGVYEDMLQRRETARLSVNLDIEGQGVNYRIQEPASYPMRWDGFQLHHYGAAGPVLGAGFVIGLIGMLVLFDGKIRSARMLQEQLSEEIVMLAAVPHYNSSIINRLMRVDILLLAVVLGLFMAAYGSVLLFSVMGVQPEALMQRVSNQFLG
ncbi:MAG: XrtA system polysaccharide chain length determinant [Saccharospirillum sp.]